MDNEHSINISFEFFPPKSLEGMDKLRLTAQKLSKINPEFFSVTFGAGGSTREGTLQTVMMLQEDTNIPIAPHLACIGTTRDALTQILLQYQTLGLKRIVALRGDLPSGMGYSSEFRYASELVTLIREVTGDFFYIEVAAYPEFHPQASNAIDDVANLKRKILAGANSAITQYFFNPDAYFYFVDLCAKHGIFVPITPGIMPVTHFSKLVRFSEMCGAEIPRWIRKRLEAYNDDLDSVKAFGLEVVCNLCERLILGGAPGLHFYTLNHADASLDVLKMLNSIKRFELIK